MTYTRANRVADKLDIRYGSAYYIIHEDLRYHKICARWVPKQLTDEHKQACVEMCMQYLQQYHEWDAFLQWIVTGDETCVHHYEPASECENMQMKHTP
jgi:hypothetical protein